MDNICRTCLSTANLTPIKEDESLIEKIKLISSIHIALDTDNYPCTICHSCVDKVNQFYCFRKIIINTDKELRERAESLSNNVKKVPAPKKKRSCDKNNESKLPCKRVKTQSKVISTSDPNDKIKIEPTEVYFISEPKDLDKDNIVKVELDCTEDSKNFLYCSQCSLSFISGQELNDHLCSVQEKKFTKKPKSLDCKECNITFDTLKNLSNHKRKWHTAPGVCNICGVIVRADNLKKHVQKHSEEPVSCKICSKVLKNSESLRGHLLIHKGTSYECEQCEKTFTLKSEYHRHLKEHLDPLVRKKMCTICGKHVRDLKRHLFTHTEERPHICSHCNKGLTSSYALKLHMRQHTNEKPYICEYCSRGFVQKISLISHYKSRSNNCRNKEFILSSN